MSSIRKLYVLPSDYFDSLVQRSKVTTDPLINARVEIEKQKAKIIKERKNVDEKMNDLTDMLHHQNFLDEQIKLKKMEPVTVEIAPEMPKKRGRTPKIKDTFPEYNMIGSGVENNTLLENFYMYEPKKRRIKTRNSNVSKA